MKKNLRDAKIIIDGKPVDITYLNPEQITALILKALGVKDEKESESVSPRAL